MNFWPIYSLTEPSHLLSDYLRLSDFAVVVVVLSDPSNYFREYTAIVTDRHASQTNENQTPVVII